MKINSKIKQQFLSFMLGETSLLEFEKWVYSYENLEMEIGEEKNFILLEFNYKKPGACYELFNLLNDFIGLGEFHKYKIIQLFDRLEKDDDEFPDALIECYEMYCKGCFFLENLGLTWGLMLRCPPSNYGEDSWSDLTEDKKNILLQSLDKDEIKKELLLVKKWILQGKISFTGIIDDLNYWQYNDNRTEDEKNPKRR